MGATTFYISQRGESAQDAFGEAVRRAQYDHGHSGYTGTIAEKNTFVLITVENGDGTVYKDQNGHEQTDPDFDPEHFADMLINECDDRVDDKWGPSGCIKLMGEDGYLFFGWASC